MQIEITDKEIDYAESILLPKDCHFDIERRDFIKDLSTLDLQAVPGSGKTTALLAKLLILETKMPFEDNSGILVISHTNVAVNEIKEKLERKSPKLFKYPNYIGTIQSFVDNFLANPFYVNKFHHSPYRIDDEIYHEACNYFLSLQYNAGANWINKKTYRANSILNTLEYNNNFNVINVDGLKDSNSKAFLAINKFKKTCLENGLLNYLDTFNIASFYIESVPKIKSILSLRFKYVFVDEMQDMSEIQYKLLEELFFNSPVRPIFQRIGDTNQSIYSEDHTETTDFFELRNKVLQLNGSQRLSKNIASLVQRFAIYKQSIEGRMKYPDGKDIDIKPYLIIYTKENKNLVIEKFIYIIKELKNQEKILNIQDERYAAIGWRKKVTDSEEKYNISSYWNHYNVLDIKSKNDYNTLKDYLVYYDKNYTTLEAIRKNILNAFIKILRIEDKKTESGLYFTKRAFIDFLRDTDPSFYNAFNLELLKICKLIILNETTKAIEYIRCYLPKLLNFYGVQIVKSYEFINSDLITIQSTKQIKQDNSFEKDGISVKVQTVHSIKGQTYTGILYLDTFYKKFESEKLAKYFVGESISDYPNEKKTLKDAAKVVYVGFSRPTHLLCYAVQKDNFEKYLSTINKDEWNVIVI